MHTNGHEDSSQSAVPQDNTHMLFKWTKWDSPLFLYNVDLSHTPNQLPFWLRSGVTTAPSISIVRKMTQLDPKQMRHTAKICSKDQHRGSSVSAVFSQGYTEYTSPDVIDRRCSELQLRIDDRSDNIRLMHTASSFHVVKVAVTCTIVLWIFVNEIQSFQ